MTRDRWSRAASSVAPDAATSGWLAYSLLSFRPRAEAGWVEIGVAAAVGASVSFAAGVGRGSARGVWSGAVLQGSGVAAILAAGTLAGLDFTLPEAAWLGLLSGAFGLLARQLLSRVDPGARGVEGAIWAILVVVAAWTMTPFYFAGGVGSGDASWYASMLGDFVSQLREGIFPVWIGQGPLSFNGGVSPLRIAPGFQHIGGAIDLLTFQALEFGPLKNATLTTVAVAGVLVIYASLRAVSGGRRWVAALLAALWIAGPGTLAPAMSGDQYMSYMTVPFVPVALLGMWRLWEFDDWRARAYLAIGLAACWLCHAPIALWMTLLAALNTIAAAAIRRRWKREAGMLLFAGATAIVLGAYPIVSALAIDNPAGGPVAGGQVLLEIRKYFPGNFLPISAARGGLYHYQLGYTLIAFLALGAAMCAVARRRSAIALGITALAVAPLTLPVPWLTNLFWENIPLVVIRINNVWPMQRLFLVWSAVIVFFVAAASADPRVWQARWIRGTAGLLALAGLAWTAHEARALATLVAGVRQPVDTTRMSMDPENFQLTRYSYTPFSIVPSNYSHGYRDPWLENRLLDPATLRPMLNNADAAGPQISFDIGAIGHPRLVQHGVFTAVNDNNSQFHNLDPVLQFERGVHYALRFDFFEPNVGGFLQVKHDGLFREYILPDSGIGMIFDRPPASFGSTPTSAKVMPIHLPGKGPVAVTARLITDRRPVDRFPFARYWLYTYRREDLPIRVESWMPYRAVVDTATPAVLETPRIWQRGWTATVNGRRVAAALSPDGLAMVPIPAGRNTVILEYKPSLPLAAAFWAALGGWTVAALAGVIALARRHR